MDMSITQHLEELRRRIIASIGALAACFLFCISYQRQLVSLFTSTLPPAGGVSLQVLSPTEGFLTGIKVSFYAALILSSPVLLTQLWLFICPGLKSSERKVILLSLPFSMVLFLGGALVAFRYAVPTALTFLRAFMPADISNVYSLSSYVGFMGWAMVILGVLFQIPLVMSAMTMAGLVTVRTLTSMRRYALFGSFVLGALLTPPDVVTQICMAIPLCLLYEAGIVISRIIELRRK
jgi:sec-independent protein translocase protein TatC